jgi:hypothetical protein
MSSGAWGQQTPQGPGWYQASDGLWYPPQDAPAAATATAPAAAPVTPVAPVVAPYPVATPVAAPSGWQPGMVQTTYAAPTEPVPKFKWLYAVFTCLGLFISVFIAQIIAAFSMYAAFFGVLLKQRVHPASHDKIVRSYRAQWRLTTYLLQWRNDVPAMPTSGAIDDGTDKASLSIAYGGEGLARFGPILKIFKAIPEIIEVIIAGILFYVALVLGIIGIVTKGQFPEAQKAKIVDFQAKAIRLNAYLLLTDVKPAKV